MQVTDGDNCWLALEELTGELGESRRRDLFQRRKGGVSGLDLAREDLSTGSGNHTLRVLALDSLLELGLGGRALDLLGGRLEALEELGNLCADGLDTLGSGSSDGDTEEGSVRVREEEGLGLGTGHGSSSLTKRRRTSSPLDVGGTAKERGEDGKVGRAGLVGTVSDHHGGLSRRSGVAVKGDALLTTVVSRGRGRKTGSGAAGRGAEGGGDGLAEGLGGDTGTDDGKVRLGKGGLGKVLDLVGTDGRVGGGEKGVAETTTESELVGNVKGKCGRSGSSGKRLGLDSGENKLGVLVGKEVGGRENGREEGEEVGPASQRCSMLIRHLLVTTQELSGQEKVFPRESSREGTTVELGLTNGLQCRAGGGGLDESAFVLLERGRGRGDQVAVTNCRIDYSMLLGHIR